MPTAKNKNVEQPTEDFAVLLTVFTEVTSLSSFSEAVTTLFISDLEIRYSESGSVWFNILE